MFRAPAVELIQITGNPQRCCVFSKLQLTILAVRNTKFVFFRSGEWLKRRDCSALRLLGLSVALEAILSFGEGGEQRPEQGGQLLRAIAGLVDAVCHLLSSQVEVYWCPKQKNQWRLQPQPSGDAQSLWGCGGAS